MHAEILSSSLATHICWMENNNADGRLLKVFVCLFLHLESNQVIILWKVSKRNKKYLKPIFLLPLLTYLNFIHTYQPSSFIFSGYRFQMKQISTLVIWCAATSDETGNSTSWA